MPDAEVEVGEHGRIEGHPARTVLPRLDTVLAVQAQLEHLERHAERVYRRCILFMHYLECIRLLEYIDGDGGGKS